MSQDRESGARAAKWGLETAARIASMIGAVKVRKGSNECLLDGRRVVIKCAHKGNGYVGILSTMLDRVDDVIAVFERDDGSFDLWKLSRDDYLRFMRLSKSRSHVPNRGQQVRRADFERYGRHLSTIQI